MGTVYKARDPVLDRLVAVKMMSEELLIEEEMRARFNREAKSAAGLQHPNIVTIFDFGELEGGHAVPFIVMELLEGKSLAQLIEEKGIERLEDKIDIVVQVCRGLDYAHKRGVDPPRREAGQHPGAAERNGEGARLRYRLGRGLDDQDENRSRHGHPELHGAGADLVRRTSTTAPTCGPSASFSTSSLVRRGPSSPRPSPASSITSFTLHRRPSTRAGSGSPRSSSRSWRRCS